MAREPRRGIPDVLSRLRRDAEGKLDEPVAPRWAKPVGWLISLGIIVVVIILIVQANPL